MEEPRDMTNEGLFSAAALEVWEMRPNQLVPFGHKLSDGFMTVQLMRHKLEAWLVRIEQCESGEWRVWFGIPLDNHRLDCPDWGFSASLTRAIYEAAIAAVRWNRERAR